MLCVGRLLFCVDTRFFCCINTRFSGLVNNRLFGCIDTRLIGVEETPGGRAEPGLLHPFASVASERLRPLARRPHLDSLKKSKLISQISL
jgi:hypothetical protein